MPASASSSKAKHICCRNRSKPSLAGDVAIAPKAGHVWPMKNWAYYAELKTELEKMGLTVNVLPERASLLEHLGDVKNHRCLVSGDSLPMHFALAAGTRCVTLFNCTSPWEIYDYGIQRKITSPLLAEFFFKRGLDERATTAIPLPEVFNAVMEQLPMSGENSQVSMLTAGRDRPYALGLAAALTAAGAWFDFVGSNEVDGPELHASPQVHFLNLRGDQSVDAGPAEKNFPCAGLLLPAACLCGDGQAKSFSHFVEQQI